MVTVENLVEKAAKVRSKNILETFWTDDEVIDWNKDTKYLYFYLITSPLGHYTGVYVFHRDYVSLQTGLSLKEVSHNLKILVDSGKVFHEQKTSTIFVKNMFKYSIMFGKGRASPNQKIGAKNHFSRLAKTCLIDKFYEVYPDAKP